MRLNEKILSKIKDRNAQMTLELAIVFPILIIIAVVLVNALSFAGECARFDRVSRNAIRTQTTSPAASSNSNSLVSVLQSELDGAFDMSNEDVVATFTNESAGLTTYECTLVWRPTLFGMGLKKKVFGVRLFELEHKIELTTDPHRSGDIL